MRLERENDLLAQQLLTKQVGLLEWQLMGDFIVQIGMRSELDKLEDLNASLEKEVSFDIVKDQLLAVFGSKPHFQVGSLRRDLEETSQERILLGEEAEQLKLVLKREVVLVAEMLSFVRNTRHLEKMV